jgi:hypothetical protein
MGKNLIRWGRKTVSVRQVLDAPAELKTLSRIMYETLIHSKLSLINYILILSDMISHNIATAAWLQHSLHVWSNVEGPLTTRSVEHWVEISKT